MVSLVSGTDLRYMDMAMSAALNSRMSRAHLGCVAVASGRVVSRGCNSYRTQSRDGLITGCSCHAEIEALRGATRHCNRTRGKFSHLIKG